MGIRQDRVYYAIMPCMRRSSKKLPKDSSQLAAEIVRLSTEESDPAPSIKEYLASIGRKGGLKGGRARADKLSSRRKKQIAQKAAKARWSQTLIP